MDYDMAYPMLDAAGNDYFGVETSTESSSFVPRGVDVINGGNSNSSSNASAVENVTVICTNEYCVSDSEYLDMILDYLFPEPFEWALIVAYALVFVIGLVGNFLVCFAVWRNKSMRTATNYFIVNLAVADFLVVLICLPPTLLEDIGETWFMGMMGCKVVKYLQAVTVIVSILTLSCISVERFYAICKPLSFKSTTSRTRTHILVTWAVSLTITVPELLALETIPNKPSYSVLLTSCRSKWPDNYQTAYQIFQLIATFLLPFCLMAVLYVVIAIKLWSTAIPTETSSSDHSSSSHHHCRRDHLQHGESSVARSQTENQLLSRRKVAKMLIAVVVMFGICFLPVYLLNILRYTGVVRSWSHVVKSVYVLLAHWLCYFNSAINPVIYNFMSTKFRREFRNAWVCVTCAPKEDRQSRAMARHNVMHSYSHRYSNVVAHKVNGQHYVPKSSMCTNVV